MPAQSESKITQLNKIGKPLLNRLKKIGIETVRDLIFYYPFRYDDYSVLYNIGDLKEGMEATVIGKIELIASRRSFRKKALMTEAILTDGTGSIKLLWFNQSWVSKSLLAGEMIRVYGRVGGDAFNLSFNSPNYDHYNQSVPQAVGLMSVYPLTAGLTIKQLRLLFKYAKPIIRQVADFLPLDIIKENGLIGLSEALLEIHFPTEAKKLQAAHRRLAFDELFLLQAWSQLLRKDLSRQTSLAITFQEQKIKEFVSGLPFDLTADQKRASWEIIKDLQAYSPMNRLLEGDVGSGKTLVAMLAMYNTALGGYQSVLMAPTEILATQHYQTFKKILAGKNINLGLLTRTQKVFNGQEVTKKEMLEYCSSGEVKIIIGTHALIQESVKFKNLALVIIDEQHRFGVKQRSALKSQGKSDLSPHFLSLTATPIPRSLALVFYGDLDISIIKQMPMGRKPIITRAVSPDNRDKAYEFIRKQIDAGRQVFVICPLIDPSDKLGFKSVTEEHQKLDEEVYPDLSVGLLHGRLKAEEKEAIMREFKEGKIKLLVSTSVVEVGVDVPNATVMMIEGADRFGLSQLHQFRGRVGRGEHQSYCFLFSESNDMKVANRLEFLAKCSDGFALAEFDMKNRGSGVVFGEQQSGFADNLKIADPGDLELAQKARDAAKNFVANFDLAEFPELKKKIEQLGYSSHLE